MDHCILVANLVILEINVYLLIFIALDDGTSFNRFFLFFLVVIILDFLDGKSNGLSWLRAILVLIDKFAKFPFGFWNFFLLMIVFMIMFIFFRLIM